MSGYDYFKEWEPFTERKIKELGAFEGGAAGFIAGTLNSGGYLFPKKYEAYKSFAASQTGFGYYDDPEVRVRLYEKLLQEQGNAFPEAPEDLSVEAADKLAECAVKALEYSETVNSDRIKAVEAFIQDFKLERTKYAERLDSLTTNTEDIESDALLICEPRQSVENQKTEELINKLRYLNKFMQSEALEAELSSVENSIESHAYRIALIGETKHGKSSLLNRLAGLTLSPVDDGTAAVLEVFYSERLKYEAAWMPDEEMEEALKTAKENGEHLKAYKLEELMNKSYVESGSIITNIRTKNELKDFICTNGSFSAGVESVSIGYPLEALKPGAVLVDMPGLREGNEKSFEIAEQQAAIADVVIFVMRADNYMTEPQKRILEAIKRVDKQSALIIAVTYDEKSDKDLKKICKEIKERCNAPVFAIEIDAEKTDKEEKEFGQKIQVIIDANDMNEHYGELMAGKRKSLCDMALAEADVYLQGCLSYINDTSRLDKLKSLSPQLENLLGKCASSINYNIKLVSIKHKSDYDALIFETDQCKNVIKQNIRAAAEEKAEIGDDFKAGWDKFFDETAKDIIFELIKGFETKAQTILTSWENAAEDFETKAAGLIKEMADNLTSIEELYTPAGEYALCGGEMFNNVKNKIRKVLTFRTEGISSIKEDVTKAVAAAFPQDMQWAPTGFNLGFIFDKFKDKEKQKESFIKGRIDGVVNTADKSFDVFMDEIGGLFKDIESYIVSVVEENYVPIVHFLRLNVLEIKYQHEIAEKLINDLKTYIRTQSV